METQKGKICKYCQKPITGRRDKMYCDSNCRALYHHDKKLREEAHFYEVLDILKTNRKILLDLNPTGHSTLRKSFMAARGYNFNYFTNIYKTDDGAVYYFCFEVGFRENTKQKHKVTIVNWQKYMEKYDLPIGRNV